MKLKAEVLDTSPCNIAKVCVGVQFFDVYPTYSLARGTSKESVAANDIDTGRDTRDRDEAAAHEPMVLEADSLKRAGPRNTCEVLLFTSCAWESLLQPSN